MPISPVTQENEADPEPMKSRAAGKQRKTLLRNKELNIVHQVCDSCESMANAGGPQVLGFPELHIEFKASRAM